MKGLIDSHCHLNLFPESELEQIVNRALESDVVFMHTICTKMEEFSSLLKIADKYPSVYASVGVHPNDANVTTTAEEIINACQNEKVIAIGETGLDYYRDSRPPEVQKQSFIEHIKASRETGLPVVIHSREADEDMIKILTEEQAKGKFKAVMHSFASSYKLFCAAVDLELYISFSGIVTFKNAKTVKRAAKEVPVDKILIETDAPYLAPEPNRGKRNEPAFISHTADYINFIRSQNDILERSYDNFFALFDKADLHFNHKL